MLRLVGDVGDRSVSRDISKSRASSVADSGEIARSIHVGDQAGTDVHLGRRVRVQIRVEVAVPRMQIDPRKFRRTRYSLPDAPVLGGR